MARWIALVPLLLRDEGPSPALTQMLDEIEDAFRRDPGKVSELSGKADCEKLSGRCELMG